MNTSIPKWIKPDDEYPLMKLVNKGVFPNMKHYTTVLHNLIEPDVIKHRVVKRFDSDGSEKVYARRYWVKGWSLIEYMKTLNEKKSRVIKIQRGTDVKTNVDEARPAVSNQDDFLLRSAERHIKKGSEIYNKEEAEINKRAEKLFKEALTCLLNIQRKTPKIYTKVGMLYQWLRDHELALHYINTALDEAGDAGNKYEAKYWKAITLHDGFKRNAEALKLFFECLDQATEPAEKLNILDWIMRVHLSEQPKKEDIRAWINSVTEIMKDQDTQRVVDSRKLLPIASYVVHLQNSGLNDELMDLVELGLSFNRRDSQLLFTKAQLLYASAHKAEAKEVAKQLSQVEKMHSYQRKQLDVILSDS